MSYSRSASTATIVILLCCLGCNPSPSETSESAAPQESLDQILSAQADAPDASNTTAAEEPASISQPPEFEIDAETLLASTLTPAQLEDGWVRLDDGQSLFGWLVVGKANWNVRDGIIEVSQGERSYLCTSFQLADYEFKVDFRASAQTNSGIFLRTPLQPENVEDESLELNIAPTDNPFPTGSLVQRQKLEPDQLNAAQGKPFDPTQWHTYHVRLVGGDVEIQLDGKTILQMSGIPSQDTGHISLQHNEGKVEFRNVLLKPLQGKALKLGTDWQDDWQKSEKEGAQMAVEPSDDGLRLTGGLGQLQSKTDHDDFFLRASYTLAQPEVNSGIFFRCIRDNMLDGYECQVNHAVEEGDPMRPADAGAGAIFRRQAARVVVGDGTSKTFMSILVSGPQIVTWVNGLPICDFTDTREPDENPRRGLRTDAGPISLQSHDPKSDVTFHSLEVTDL